MNEDRGVKKLLSSCEISIPGADGRTMMESWQIWGNLGMVYPNFASGSF